MTFGHAQLTFSAPAIEPQALAAPDEHSGVQSRWLSALCVVLLGYALFGKGFAYIGVPPLFVGELLLAWGLWQFFRSGHLAYAIGSPAVWSLVALAGWGTLTTAPHLSMYGMESLRDAMIWGYAAFAVLVMGALLAEPGGLRWLVKIYERFATIFLILIPAFYAGSQLSIFPMWPWAAVSVIDVKGGDVLVHSGGILAFWATGLGRRVNKGWVVLLVGCVAVVGASNRGGLVAFLMAYGICLIFRPFNRLLWSIVAAGLFALLVLAALDLRIELPGKRREFSSEQIVENVQSVFGRSHHSDLDGTKQWRLRWWSDIVNYTWNGDYFWTGKGFGINLADDDGYQGLQWDGLLRSPHNGHLTMLARAGVPGIIFWLIPQILWLLLIGRRCLQTLAAGDLKWNSLFVFLLAYWAALITRASFDVYLEGPVGGVWFWTIYGIGLSACVIYRYVPEILDESRDDDENFAGT